LAVSANSPFLDGHDTGLHSVRTEIFTRTFPRCGVHEPFGDWGRYADFIGRLAGVGAIVESTQLWWSVRPHHRFGTVEFRICDAQTRGDESFALAALIAGCVAQSALDYDAGRLPDPLSGREIEENLWRAIRWGMDGEMIDWRGTGGLVPTAEVVARLVDWSAEARGPMGAEVGADLAPNGAQRARAAYAAGTGLADLYRDVIEETRRTYVPAAAPAQ
jgi:carboxylate-amine ligase